MPHENVDRLNRVYDALDAEDMETFWAAFSDDVVVHVAGKSSIGGTHRGKEALQQTFGGLMERAGEWRDERHAVLADDEHCVILWKVHAVRGEERFDGTETEVLHLRDGLITEGWFAWTDQDLFDAYLG